MALHQALTLADPGLDSLALQRVATEWARSDIRAALRAAHYIADANLRAAFQGAVLREWAWFDLDGVFEYYLGLDLVSQEDLAAQGSLREVARLDPYRALELCERLTGTLRIGIEQTALQSIAQRDPEAALQYVSRLPPGQQRQVARSIARAFGKQDLEAGLAWARATGVRDNLIGALGGIAITNPRLAFEVLATLPSSDRSRAVQSLLNGVIGDRGTNVAALAEGILGLEGSFEDELGPRVFGNVLGQWAARSLSSALDWIIANGERVPPNAFASLAANFVRNDVATAEQYFSRVPTKARFAWLQGMAQTYALTDPVAAAVWVDPYRNEVAYSTAVAHIAQPSVRYSRVAGLRTSTRRCWRRSAVTCRGRTRSSAPSIG